MTYNNNRLLKKLNIAGKAGFPANTKDSEGEGDIMDMMMDPRYLRQSSSLINEALQKGFDVLQLANGDIVTTGTKTVVYQYTWDADKAKLVKTKPETGGAKKAGRRSGASEYDDADQEIEAEDA